MNVNKMQAIISILVIAVFVIATCIIALIPILAERNPQLYTEHLKTFASLYSGIIGIIVGYYFGKGRSKE